MVGKLTGDRLTGPGGVPPKAGSPAPTRIRRASGTAIQPTEHITPPELLPSDRVALGSTHRITRKSLGDATRTEPIARDTRSVHALWQSKIDIHRSDPALEQEKLKLTTSLIGSRCSMQEAMGFVEKLRRSGVPPTVQIYGALMTKAERERQPEVVLQLLGQLQDDRIVPNQFIFTSVITALGKLGRTREAEGAFRLMEKSGHRADLKAFGALMSVHANRGDHRAVEALYHEIEGRHDLTVDDRIRGTRVLAYGKAGELDSAMKHFDKMLDAGITPHLAVCNTLIAACEKSRSAGVALRIFRSMNQRGTSPNSVTFSTLMQTCVSSGDPVITFDAIESGKHCGLLRKSTGWNVASKSLGLWPKDVLANETEWRCPASALAAVGTALAQFHLTLGNLTAASDIDGPEPAKRTARAVQQSIGAPVVRSRL